MSTWTKVGVVQFFTGRMLTAAPLVVVRFRYVRRSRYEQSEVWQLQTPAGGGMRHLDLHTNTSPDLKRNNSPVRARRARALRGDMAACLPLEPSPFWAALHRLGDNEASDWTLLMAFVPEREESTPAASTLRKTNNGSRFLIKSFIRLQIHLTSDIFDVIMFD